MHCHFYLLIYFLREEQNFCEERIFWFLVFTNWERGVLWDFAEERRMWSFSRKGASGFSASSTAEEVTQRIDGTGLTAIVTGHISSGLNFPFSYYYS